jgi:hypothetical protein
VLEKRRHDRNELVGRFAGGEDDLGTPSSAPAEVREAHAEVADLTQAVPFEVAITSSIERRPAARSARRRLGRVLHVVLFARAFGFLPGNQTMRPGV